MNLVFQTFISSFTFLSMYHLYMKGLTYVIFYERFLHSFSGVSALQALKVVRWRLISQEKSQYLSLRKRLLTFARKREREFLRRRKAFLMISQRIGWRRGIMRRFFVRLKSFRKERKEKVVVLLARTKNRVGCTSFFFWQDLPREAEVEGKRHLSPLIHGHFSPIGGDTAID